MEAACEDAVRDSLGPSTRDPRSTTQKDTSLGLQPKWTERWPPRQPSQGLAVILCPAISFSLNFHQLPSTTAI